MRELRRDDTWWQVREVDTSHVPGARARRCLIVESERVVRRVWAYPPDWSALSDETLWAILDQMWAAHDTERECLESHAAASREDMRDAAVRYAEVLKRDGVSPERALVMLKAAVQNGLGPSRCADQGAAAILDDIVGCCIHAYYDGEPRG